MMSFYNKGNLPLDMKDRNGQEGPYYLIIIIQLPYNNNFKSCHTTFYPSIHDNYVTIERGAVTMFQVFLSFRLFLSSL